MVPCNIHRILDKIWDMARNGRIPKRGTVTKYRGIKYRSKWEVYIAKLLLYSDIAFLYEPQRFQLAPSLSYLPDFYIPSKGFFMEVKGVLNNKDKILLKLFSRQYRVIYLGRNQLDYLHNEGANNLSRIDIVNYVPTDGEVQRFKEFLDDAWSNQVR